jgi:hypothetical protein
MKNNKPRRRITKTVAMHYVKLVYRSVLFVTALVFYIYGRINGAESLFCGYEKNSVVLNVIWIVYMVEMILRLFPSRLESMGCQKQFKKNYMEISPPVTRPKVHPWLVTFSVASAWIALNAVIGVLYYTKLIDTGILLLICLAYSVCDIVCILFFCPFQTWFMKNKCCGSCRIYNWDYAMMFTPLIYVPNPYAISLLGTALVILGRWEYVYLRYPQRFSEEHNRSLSCAECTEKLCQHKRQLQGFLKKGKHRIDGNSFIKGLIKKDEKGNK